MAAIVGHHLSIQDPGSLRFLTQAFADHRANTEKPFRDLKHEKYLLEETIRKLESDRDQVWRELNQLRATYE